MGKAQRFQLRLLHKYARSARNELDNTKEAAIDTNLSGIIEFLTSLCLFLVFSIDLSKITAILSRETKIKDIQHNRRRNRENRDRIRNLREKTEF